MELLFRTFGDVLAPLDQVRARYFHKLNAENFTRALNSRRVPLPVTALDPSAKASQFVDIRHLAVLIDHCADQADDALATALGITHPDN